MAINDIIKALQKHDVEVGENVIDKLVKQIHIVLTEEDSDLLESLEEHLSKIVETVKEELKNETKQMMKNTKGKKSKDPNAPKRPPSAYNLFIKDNMNLLSKEHPDMSRQDLMKVAVQRYRESKGDKKEDGKLLSDTDPEEDSEVEKKISAKKDTKKKGGK